MPDTPQTRPITPDEFRHAAEAYHAAVEAVAAQHVTALGGLMGLLHADVERLGSRCTAILAIAPEARPRVLEWLTDLCLHVSTAGTRPQ